MVTMTKPLTKAQRAEVTALLQRIAIYTAERKAWLHSLAATADCVFEDESHRLNSQAYKFSALPPAPKKMEDDKAEVQDPLLEVNLGDGTESRPTFISKLLPEEQQSQMVALLKEFRDSFAWDYDEMPGLDRKLIEHRLPIKEGFTPYKQPPRRMAPDIIPAGRYANAFIIH